MTLLEFHVLFSLVEMVVGLIVLYGLLTGKAFGAWTALFFIVAILTSVTGFPLAPSGFDPPRAVGILTLVLLAIAVCAYYSFRLAGAWRWVYVVTALIALYLDVFVGVIQSFMKIPSVHGLAPDPIGTVVSRGAGRRSGALRRARILCGAQVSSGLGAERLRIRR
jgi:hypothetical protein